jgi:hypothetical protein
MSGNGTAASQASR